jgi:hypothetical protein
LVPPRWLPHPGGRVNLAWHWWLTAVGAAPPPPCKPLVACNLNLYIRAILCTFPSAASAAAADAKRAREAPAGASGRPGGCGERPRRLSSTGSCFQAVPCGAKQEWSGQSSAWLEVTVSPGQRAFTVVAPPGTRPGCVATWAWSWALYFTALTVHPRSARPLAGASRESRWTPRFRGDPLHALPIQHFTFSALPRTPRGSVGSEITHPQPVFARPTFHGSERAAMAPRMRPGPATARGGDRGRRAPPRGCQVGGRGSLTSTPVGEGQRARPHAPSPLPAAQPRRGGRRPGPGEEGPERH